MHFIMISVNTSWQWSRRYLEVLADEAERYEHLASAVMQAAGDRTFIVDQTFDFTVAD